jgi:predicted transposase YbfD/YdcC
MQLDWDADVQKFTKNDSGHGRLEKRTITTTTWMNDYLDGWPELGQAFRLERTRKIDDVTTVEVVYGITSLNRMEANAEQLQVWIRDHWGIENGLHYRRDESLGEDRCRVRKGSSPRVLASLRSVVIQLLSDRDQPSLPAAMREITAFPEIGLELIQSTM